MIKKQANRFFRWYCNPDYYEDIQGDLEELFRRYRRDVSLRRAEWQYAWEVLRLFRPAIIRPFNSFRFLNPTDMIKNYFKISVRNLLKYKWYTAIHILGLALGLAAFLLINQYTSFEKSYDRYHYEPDNLYRLTTDNIVEGVIQARDAMSFAPSGQALQNELPEIISHSTTYKMWRMIFRKNDQPMEEEMVVAADSNFLKLFKYPLLKGEVEEALKKPNTIVLTQSAARKYFGEQDPMGQSMEALGRFNRPFEVVGLIEDVPPNTHYKFDMLISLGSIQEQIENDAWNGFNYYTYLLLDGRADTEKVQEKLTPLSQKYIGEESNLVFNLQAVKDIHLHSDFTFEPEIHGSARAVKFLNIISIFILLIAWVNYINLSTARAVERAREVGVRKVVGARKKQLIGQFLVESLLINFLGALFAVMIVQILTPYFHNLVGKTILISVLTNIPLLQKLALFFLLGTFVAGFYPALVLSSFQPIGVLKGTFSRSKQGVLLRKVLVVVQFAASLILIANTAIVYQQVRYLTSKDMGINIDQVVGFENPQVDRDQREQYRSKYKTFVEELGRLEGVEEVGSVSNLPGGGSADISSNSGGIRIVGQSERISSTIYIMSMNDQYQDVLDIELLAGRDFDRDIAGDTSGVIVNKALLTKLNISDPASVIDERLQFGRNENNPKYQIVGVFNDYNRTSLKNLVEPTVFFYRETTGSTIAKLSGKQLAASIDRIQSTWREFFPETPFEYTFLDQRFAKLYLEDKKFGFLFANFALLAILVASMGLLGLSSYLSIQRTKEVGVRKVLGASTSHIILLFFKDFIWLILAAIVIGVPLIYFGMNEWLNSYAYRIGFPWWVLFLAMVLVAVLAFITVSYQTYKIAILNPARTIRYE